MEGHSGSFLYYPMILAIGMFPWSIILLAIPAHALFLWRTKRLTSSHFRAITFAGCWALVWVGTFSLAGTKLPGYIWPAYPAISIATALYVADWIRGHTGWEKVVFRNMTADKAASMVMHIGFINCVWHAQHCIHHHYSEVQVEFVNMVVEGVCYHERWSRE